MSGTDAHLGGMGTLLEFKLKQPGYQRWNGKPGYEGYLNDQVATIPEILSDNGYCTLMSGKVSHLMLYSSDLKNIVANEL